MVFYSVGLFIFEFFGIYFGFTINLNYICVPDIPNGVFSIKVFISVRHAKLSLYSVHLIYIVVEDSLPPYNYNVVYVTRNFV